MIENPELIIFRTTKEHKLAMKIAAAKENIPMTQYMARLLREHLESISSGPSKSQLG